MNIKRLVASVSALAMVMTSNALLVSAEDTNSDLGEIVVSSTFEDGLGGFSPRMNEGQSVEVSVVNDGTAHGGNGYLLCTNREKSWQGAQFLTDDILEGGKKYIVNAWLKTPWYSTITLSMQYTDSTGKVNYTNIQNVVSQGDWAELSGAKVQIPMDATEVYLYFECSDANVDIAIDDFEIYATPEYKIQEDIASLKDVYSPYFKFGGAMMASELGSQSTKDLVLKHYNSITFGNELKPENVLQQEQCQALAQAGNKGEVAVSIDSARSLLNFCQENNIPVRGHVLVWHSQTPGWFFKEGYSDDGDFVSKEVMLQRMESYIKNLMELLATEYPDVDFYAWDVVNEAWLDDGSYRTGGTYDENPNYSGWVKVFGDNSFIDYAFEYARKYAPEGCKLYYNDFNEYMPQKTQAIVDMANRLKEKGLIDGIGMQSHLDVGFPTVSTYEKALKAFCDTGLDVQITELDITTSDTSETGLETQAKMYSDIMDLAVKYSDSISAVVIWGTTDDQSWRSAKVPVLFNEDYTAKPCYYSIVDGLEVPNPPTTTTTTTPTTPVEAIIGKVTSIEECSEYNGLQLTIQVDEETKTIIINDDTMLGGKTNSLSDYDIKVGDYVRYTISETDESFARVLDIVAPTNPDVLLGDANEDGKINTIDVLTIKRYLLHLADETSLNITNSDTNKDGVVRSNDITIIKKYLLHIIDTIE
ncbi:MAG: endo-1,4-beta-xylanase [Oscillospiraceae bacterium]